jgi:hypothetical protein
MVKKWLSLLLCALVAGCENVHHSIVNMTSCPIMVTYSEANIRNNTVILQPGEAAGGFGGMFGRLSSLQIRTPGGSEYSFDREDLERVRPPHTLEDRFGWFGNRLDYLKRMPKTASGERRIAASHTCCTCKDP